MNSQPRDAVPKDGPDASGPTTQPPPPAPTGPSGPAQVLAPTGAQPAPVGEISTVASHLDSSAAAGTVAAEGPAETLEGAPTQAAAGSTQVARVDKSVAAVEDSSTDSARGSLPRIGIVLLVIAAGWLSITAAQQLANIVAPLLLTLNLVIVAFPVQARLTRMGVPRIIGAVASGVIVFAILLAFFAALAWSMSMLVQEIPGYQAQFQELYRQVLQQLQRFGVSETQALAQLQSQLSPSRVVEFASQALSGVTGVLSTLLVTVTIIFVVLMDSMGMLERLAIAARRDADIVDALTGFARGVRKYWIVSSVFGAIVAAIDVAALAFLGVPLAIVWGVLSFLTNYIPNIGFVIGIIPPTLMALLANGPQTALLVVVAYCVINFIIQSLIQPKYLGNAVGVTATVSLLSLLFWAWVLGPLGALLALPATLLCKALLVDIDPRMRWLDAFIASDPEARNQAEKGRGHRTGAEA